MRQETQERIRAMAKRSQELEALADRLVRSGWREVSEAARVESERLIREIVSQLLSSSEVNA